MVAKKKLQPIGEVLSPETAFIQASNILDVAMVMAEERQDIDGMSKIAAVYMELGSRLMVISEEVDVGEEEEDECENKQPIGFAPVIVQPVQEVELSE